MKRTSYWRLGGVIGVSLGLLAALSLSQPRLGSAAEEKGLAVVDGDSVQVGDRVFHLDGIDAPELGQACGGGKTPKKCGLEAAFVLRKHIALNEGIPVCEPLDGTTPGGEIVGACALGEEDLAMIVLRNGLAVPTYDASETYRIAAHEAETASLGLWHEDFIMPATWRETRPAVATLDPCPVVAMTDGRGHKVFAVPTDEGYETLREKPAGDAVLFCSDEAARADGFRRQGERTRGE